MRRQVNMYTSTSTETHTHAEGCVRHAGFTVLRWQLTQMPLKVTLQNVTALLHYLLLNNDYGQLRGLSERTLRVYSVNGGYCLPVSERERRCTVGMR